MKYGLDLGECLSTIPYLNIECLINFELHTILVRN